MHFLRIVGERESAAVAADFVAIFSALLFFSRNDNSLKKPVQHRQHHLQKQKDKNWWLICVFPQGQNAANR